MDFGDRRDWRIVLIGTAEYERLPDLPAVAHNLTALEDVLTDPALGGIPPSHVTVLANPVHPSTVYEAVRGAAADAEDTLLVYFAGHGLLDPDEPSSLHLAMTAADGDNPYTAIDAKGVLRAVRRSPARNRVVILDCCFSGRALAESMSAPEAVLELLDPEGSCLITATTANEQALAPAGATYTAFTGILLDILRRGVPGDGPAVTLRDVYTWLQLRCEREGLPLPQWRGVNTVDRLPLVRNRSAVPVPLALSEDSSLTVEGWHKWPRRPWWATLLSASVWGVLAAAIMEINRHGEPRVVWWGVALGAGGVLLALILRSILRGSLGNREYTLQVDRHGLVVRYPRLRARRFAWQDLTSIEVTDRLAVRPRQPVELPHARYNWQLPRREGELLVLAVTSELKVDRGDLELALARAAPSLAPALSPAPESAELALRKGEITGIWVFCGILYYFFLAVVPAVAPGIFLPGRLGARAWEPTVLWLQGLFLLGQGLVVLVWLCRSGGVRFDAEGLTARLGGRRLTLPWSRIELLTTTGMVPGTTGDANPLLVARVHKGTTLPRPRLPGPWRTRDGMIVLLPLSPTDTWRLAAAQRFAGPRWQPDTRPWSAVLERPDHTVIPLRLRGITFAAFLLLAIGVCVALDLLFPPDSLGPAILGPVLLVPAGLHAFHRLIAGDTGELRIDQHGITGRLLGRELISISWTSVMHVRVQTEKGLSLRLAVKDTNGRDRYHRPLARDTPDGVEIFPIAPKYGYLAATPQDLERALERFWMRTAEVRQSGQPARPEQHTSEDIP